MEGNKIIDFKFKYLIFMNIPNVAYKFCKHCHKKLQNGICPVIHTHYLSLQNGCPYCNGTCFTRCINNSCSSKRCKNFLPNPIFRLYGINYTCDNWLHPNSNNIYCRYCQNLLQMIKTTKYLYSLYKDEKSFLSKLPKDIFKNILTLTFIN